MKVHVCFVRLHARRYFLRYKFLALFFSALFLLVLVKVFTVGGQTERAISFPAVKRSKTTTPATPIYLNPERLKQVAANKKANNLMAKKNKTELKMKWLAERIEDLSRMRPKVKPRHVEVNGTVGPNYNVHVFYYAWYETPEVDRVWHHWNHEYLKDWRKETRKVYPTGRHVPPDDIGSNFYPKLGCYSSRDKRVMYRHMIQMKEAGIGVLIVSWYPPGKSDGSSHSPDTVFLDILNVAHKYRLKVAPHIEPYEGRTPSDFRKMLKYFTKSYENHPALYKMTRKNRDLIVYYIYDSYRTSPVEWRELFSPSGNITVRGTSLDGIFLGLLVDNGHKYDIKRARFDGFYTYFASNGFSYGSSWKNWKSLSVFARAQDLIFVPSIGPGYIDTRVRAWNGANTRDRRRGKYYDVGWRSAIGAGASFVSITSFNEWHEGTQIEPAVPKVTKDYVYLDYEPEGPDFYLNLTKFWVNEFSKKSTGSVPIF